MAGDASGNPGDGGKPLATAGESSVALHKKAFVARSTPKHSLLLISCLNSPNAQITYYMFIDDEPKNEKTLDDVLDVGSCNIKNYLSQIQSKLEDLGRASTGRESGHCVADAGVSFGTAFSSLLPNHYIKHIQYIQIHTDYHRTSFIKPKQNLFQVGWHAVA